MWLYIKRVVPFFAITFIFLSGFCNDFIKAVSGRRLNLYVKRTAVVIIILLLSVQITNQSRYLLKLYPNIKTYSVERNSRDLDGLLPGGSTIYMHCYGFRFFWQTHHRIISADDQRATNQMILDKAVQEGAKYVLLSRRGLPCTFREGYRARLLKEYHLEAGEPEYGDDYKLFEIRYN